MSIVDKKIAFSMIKYAFKEEWDMAQSILIVDDEKDIVLMLSQYFL